MLFFGLFIPRLEIASVFVSGENCFQEGLDLGDCSWSSGLLEAAWRDVGDTLGPLSSFPMLKIILRWMHDDCECIFIQNEVLLSARPRSEL